nr:MAG TPA: hypothetical protein [Caudoviricetes sp.]
MKTVKFLFYLAIRKSKIRNDIAYLDIQIHLFHNFCCYLFLRCTQNQSAPCYLIFLKR